MSDAAVDPIFDALTRTAVLVTGAPIARFSLIVANRPWFISDSGFLYTTETPWNQAFLHMQFSMVNDSKLLMKAQIQDLPTSPVQVASETASPPLR